MKGLKRIRERRKLKQIDIAVALGIDRSTVAMWETGKSYPQGKIMIRLADMLGCTIDELFGRELPERAEEVRPREEARTIIGLKLRRCELRLTQEELAQKVSVTQSQVAQWERGATMPSAEKLPLIASVLGCTIDELFGREPPERAEEVRPREETGDLEQAMFNFAIRVLQGNCTPQETAILPEILQQLNKN